MALGDRAAGRELHERPRALTQDTLDSASRSLPSRAASTIQREAVAGAARREGFVAASAAAAVSGATVLGLNTLSPRFRSALGVSGKMALVVTPTAGLFFLKSHLAVARAVDDPERFAAALPDATAAPAAAAAGRAAGAAPTARLAGWQKVANYVFNNPFKSIVGTVLPLYGAIFYRESTHPSTKDMLLSQRLIHTRVYGQMIAVCTVGVVMTVTEAMKADGAYVVEGDRVLRASQATPAKIRHWYSKENPPESRTAEESGPPLDLLVPLLYAPLLPLMRIGLRGRLPQPQIERLMMGTAGLALAHAGYIMFSDSTARSQ